MHEILGFEILSSEKHFCRWDISEIEEYFEISSPYSRAHEQDQYGKSSVEISL